MSERFQLMLLGGPADEVRVDRPRWPLIGPQGVMSAAPNPLPEEVWLCRIEWPLGEWRVRLYSEPLRGESALYLLQRRPDGTPEMAMDGAYLYTHAVGGSEESTA